MPKLNRVPLPESEVFAGRQSKVKWPTLRGSRLDDDSVEELRQLTLGTRRSIIFLDGMYNTNLNKFKNLPTEERAVFFEYRVDYKGSAIFMLVWIGNYWNGCVFQLGYQFPALQNWPVDFLEKEAFKLYKRVVKILDVYDIEVLDFIREE